MGAGSSNVEESEKVSATIAKLGDGKENIVYSDILEKINRKKKTQKRALVLTEKALYYFVASNLTCKRRIDLTEITLVTNATASDEFILHVPSSYDAYFRTHKKETLIKKICELYMIYNKMQLPVVSVQQKNLMPLVTTKDISNKNQDAGAVNVVSIMKSANTQGISYDTLCLGHNEKIVEMLQSHPGNEIVKFSDYVIKVNRKGKEQKRVVMLVWRLGRGTWAFDTFKYHFVNSQSSFLQTNVAMYNLLPNFSVKRRVHISLIPHVTMKSSNSTEFIIHVMTEYDYVLKYNNREQLVGCLAEIRSELQPNKLTVSAATDESFDQLLMTQDKMNNDKLRAQSLQLLSKRISSQRRLEAVMKSRHREGKRPRSESQASTSHTSSLARSSESGGYPIVSTKHMIPSPSPRSSTPVNRGSGGEYRTTVSLRASPQTEKFKRSTHSEKLESLGK
ncbi:hypothetical protein AAMO2058_000864300 [Amorphochlora amoebiformis]